LQYFKNYLTEPNRIASLVSAPFPIFPPWFRGLSKRSPACQPQDTTQKAWDNLPGTGLDCSGVIIYLCEERSVGWAINVRRASVLLHAWWMARVAWLI